VRDPVGVNASATFEWTSTDAIIYALGVGAGGTDPAVELAFTTENSRDVEQAVIPTFGVLVAWPKVLNRIPGLDMSRVVHAGQSIALDGPLPTAGRVSTTSTVTGYYDQGSGALLTAEGIARDSNGQRLATSVSSIFVRGAGGFGGPPAPRRVWSIPKGVPDRVLSMPTSPNQALVYRLTGDRNPLHSDPAFAQAVGFPRPILHGLSTFGFVCRGLLSAVADGEVVRFESMSGRFTNPVLPGQELTMQIWGLDDDIVRYRALAGDLVVIDHGEARFSD